VKALGTAAIAPSTLLVGLVTLVMAAVIIANAIAAVLAAALDPRVRTGAGVG